MDLNLSPFVWLSPGNSPYDRFQSLQFLLQGHSLAVATSALTSPEPHLIFGGRKCRREGREKTDDWETINQLCFPLFPPNPREMILTCVPASSHIPDHSYTKLMPELFVKIIQAIIFACSHIANIKNCHTWLRDSFAWRGEEGFSEISRGLSKEDQIIKTVL